MTEKNHYGGCTYCNASFDGDEIPESEREGMAPPFIWNKRVQLKCSCPCQGTVGFECHACGITTFICKQVGNA